MNEANGFILNGGSMVEEEVADACVFESVES